MERLISAVRNAQTRGGRLSKLLEKESKMPITMKDGVLQEPEFSAYVLNLEEKHDQLISHISQLEARMRELILLMEGDIAFGKVTPGETRTMVLNEARALVPWLSPVKSSSEILS